MRREYWIAPRGFCRARRRAGRISLSGRDAGLQRIPVPAGGDTLYSNLYRPMFTLVRDGMTCFYGNGTGHPNGHDNINRGLGERRAMMDRRIGAAACSVSEGECSAPVHGDSGDYRGIERIKKTPRKRPQNKKRASVRKTGRMLFVRCVRFPCRGLRRARRRLPSTGSAAPRRRCRFRDGFPRRCAPAPIRQAERGALRAARA